MKFSCHRITWYFAVFVCLCCFCCLCEKLCIMSDISEPQDLEKAHISPWFTLSWHSEEHAAPFRREVRLHVHMPTHAKVFRCAIYHTRKWNLATRLYYVIACVWSWYVALLYVFKTTFLLLISLLLL